MDHILDVFAPVLCVKASAWVLSVTFCDKALALVFMFYNHVNGLY